MIIVCDAINHFNITDTCLQYVPFNEVFMEVSMIDSGLNYSAKKAYDLPHNACISNRIVGIHQSLGHHCYSIEFFDPCHTTLVFRKKSWFDRPWTRYDTISTLIKHQKWVLFDMS